MKLKEGICICVAAGLLSVAAVPFLRHAYAVGGASDMAQSGKDLFRAIYLARSDNTLCPPAQFTNSTDFILTLLKNDSAKELTPWDLSGSLMPKCAEKKTFSEANNAWTVRAVPDLSDENEFLPFIISRNLDASKLSEGIFKNRPLRYNLPFLEPRAGQHKWGDWAVAVVDGGAIFMTYRARKGFPLPPSVAASTNSTADQAMRYLTPEKTVDLLRNTDRRVTRASCP